MCAGLSDADLVREVGAGNREAEAELFRRMAPRLRLYGLRHLRQPQAADDLVQHVLVKTIEALRAGKLREPERLAPFVLGIGRMTVLEQWRGARRRERLLEEFGPGLVPQRQTDAPNLDRERVARCVQALRERERTVVVMTFYDEETSAEVARFLGTSDANVRVIRHRAIRGLRRCLEGAA